MAATVTVTVEHPAEIATEPQKNRLMSWKRRFFYYRIQ
jgi:hypothetical protein